MKRNIKIATAVAAGALAIGGVLAVGPVTADPGGAATVAARSTSQSMPAYSQHEARHHGDDGVGNRQHEGTCTGTALASQGTLTAAQKATLADMAEEEKLAHDLYTALAARYDVRVFERIATAETHPAGPLRRHRPDRRQVGRRVHRPSRPGHLRPAVEAGRGQPVRSPEGRPHGRDRRHHRTEQGAVRTHRPGRAPGVHQPARSLRAAPDGIRALDRRRVAQAKEMVPACTGPGPSGFVGSEVRVPTRRPSGPPHAPCGGAA
jgi:hypothetical protein